MDPDDLVLGAGNPCCEICQLLLEGREFQLCGHLTLGFLHALDLITDLTDMTFGISPQRSQVDRDDQSFFHLRLKVGESQVIMPRCADLSPFRVTAFYLSARCPVQMNTSIG